MFLLNNLIYVDTKNIHFYQLDEKAFTTLYFFTQILHHT